MSSRALTHRSTCLTRAAAIGVTIGSVASSAIPAQSAAQALEDVTRLTGVERIHVHTSAGWDELITMEAGGATEAQFTDALQQAFEMTLASADAAPSVVPGSPVTVTCHVDTFYETGLIVYALRTQMEVLGQDGLPVIAWLKSWVGSFNTGQLHLMFTLGEQCAESFLADWRSAN